MITSKQIINVSEDWLRSINVSGQLVDIYENPGESDIIKLVKSNKLINPRDDNTGIRFIADAKTLKVFVWLAYQTIHPEVSYKLNLGDVYNLPNLLGGYGKIVKNKIILDRLGNKFFFLFSHCDSNNLICKNYLKNVFKYDWSFVERYISGTIRQLEYEKKINNIN